MADRTAPRAERQCPRRGCLGRPGLGRAVELRERHRAVQHGAAQLGRTLRARVVGLGPAVLYLSVAAPPTDTNQALRIAAEHFAFCPDNVWQSSTNTLTRYAESIVDRSWWSFWWD
nr:DUF4253 domain-containing protein [Micromonospora krabiensis]